MLKIALVNPNHHTKYPQPPMGLALLAAVLERAGYPITVVDASALNLPLEAIAPLVRDADVIGLTAMTPSINFAVSTARHLKKARPDVPIILGGAHATLLPEETLASAPELDIIVRGEGEESILQLLPALEKSSAGLTPGKQPLNKIPGITYRKGGKIVSNPAGSKLVDLDSLPFLAYHLLPWHSYKPHPPHGRALPFAVIITSRGCPYHCAYCSKPIFGTRFRAQNPDRVIKEILYHQKRFGIKELAFYDDVFTLDKKRAHAIADQIIKRGIKLHWSCETRVNLVDKNLLRHMKEAGCYAISYGLESGSPEILKAIDKGITLQQATEAVRWSREVGLQTIGYFMIGSPGESPETIRQTIRFAKELKLDFAQFAVTTPFPGTKLHDLYMHGKKNADIPWENFVYAGTGEGLSPVFESDLLSRNEIRRWAKRAYREFYLRPSYYWQRLRQIKSPGDLVVNVKGLAMLLGTLRKG
ncbi:MAG: cobalamin B12-binding domain-containing protein [Chloroflexi bacterium]|nr:cobalamin B12-binding domain-containing protein [Chloroflexota bacterium]